MIIRIVNQKYLSILLLCCFFPIVMACNTLKIANPWLNDGEKFRLSEKIRMEEWNKSIENEKLEKQNREKQEAQRKSLEEVENQGKLQQQRIEENKNAKKRAEQEAQLQAQLKAEQRKEAERWLSLLPINLATYTFNGYTLNDREQTIFKTVLLDDFLGYIEGQRSYIVHIWQQISKDILIISTDKLQRDYESNEVAGDKKYMGMPLLISGTISSINRGIGKNYYLAFEGGSNMFTKPQASMADGFEDYLANLTKGQWVRLVCQGNGMFMGSAIVNKCEPCSFWFKRQENNISISIRRELTETSSKVKAEMILLAYCSIMLASTLPQSNDCFKGNIDGCLIEIRKNDLKFDDEKSSKLAAYKLKIDLGKLKLILGER